MFDRRAIPAEASESGWTAPDGHPIRRFDWAAARPRGSLLFLPGRGDLYEKYLEAIAHWHGQGWAVTSLDWRGQAGSGRAGLDPHTGHADDFAPWLADLAAFWRGWQVRGPRVMVAHSMGGHLALRALADGTIDPAALVLSAPMLGLNPGFVPARWLHALARLLAARGDPRRPAWRSGASPGLLPGDRFQLLTHDAARYADETWWHDKRPELVTGPPSWGWMVAAFASIRALTPASLARIETPVLLLAARGDRLVSHAAVRRAARMLPHGELAEWGADAAHELLREVDPVRDAVLARIDAFLERVR